MIRRGNISTAGTWTQDLQFRSLPICHLSNSASVRSHSLTDSTGGRHCPFSKLAQIGYTKLETVRNHPCFHFSFSGWRQRQKITSRQNSTRLWRHCRFDDSVDVETQNVEERSKWVDSWLRIDKHRWWSRQSKTSVDKNSVGVDVIAVVIKDAKTSTSVLQITIQVRPQTRLNP